MNTNSVATLMLALTLKRRMEPVSEDYRSVSLEECDRRIVYWAEQAIQRIGFATALMEGLKP